MIHKKNVGSWLHKIRKYNVFPSVCAVDLYITIKWEFIEWFVFIKIILIKFIFICSSLVLLILNGKWDTDWNKQVEKSRSDFDRIGQHLLNQALEITHSERRFPKLGSENSIKNGGWKQRKQNNPTKR
jgi:hypothetical protein